MTTTENLKTFDTGAVRSRDAEHVRYDLIPPEFLERLAAFIAQTADDPNQAEWLRGLSMIAMEPLRDLGATYAEGEKKYSRDNWRKGFPAGCLINHGYRHFEKLRAGDKSENHIGHGLWNFWTLATFASTRPELMVLPFAGANTNTNTEKKSNTATLHEQLRTLKEAVAITEAEIADALDAEKKAKMKPQEIDMNQATQLLKEWKDKNREQHAAWWDGNSIVLYHRGHVPIPYPSLPDETAVHLVERAIKSYEAAVAS